MTDMEKLIEAQKELIADCDEDVGCAVDEADQMKEQLDAFLHHDMKEFISALAKGQTHQAQRVRGIVRRRQRLLKQAADGREDAAASRRVLDELERERQMLSERVAEGGAPTAQGPKSV